MDIQLAILQDDRLAENNEPVYRATEMLQGMGSGHVHIVIYPPVAQTKTLRLT